MNMVCVRMVAVCGRAFRSLFQAIVRGDPAPCRRELVLAPFAGTLDKQRAAAAAFLGLLGSQAPQPWPIRGTLRRIRSREW